MCIHYIYLHYGHVQDEKFVYGKKGCPFSKQILKISEYNSAFKKISAVCSTRFIAKIYGTHMFLPLIHVYLRKFQLAFLVHTAVSSCSIIHTHLIAYLFIYNIFYVHGCVVHICSIVYIIYIQNPHAHMLIVYTKTAKLYLSN